MTGAEALARPARRGLLCCAAAGAAGSWAAGPVPPEAAAAARRFVPSAEQRAWLAANSPVRWLPEQDYAPFVWVGADGQARGLSVEILRRIADALGLALVQLPARPLRDQLALAERRRGDLVTSLRATPERAAYLLFTRPYVSVPTVLVARRAAPGGPRGPAPRLGALDGQAVAVGSGFAVEATVRAAYPRVDWQGVPSDDIGLAGVAEGRYAAAVVDAASGGHLITARPALRGLAAVADVGFRYELSFAVRSDWPVLRDILDEGIARLPRAEMAALRQQWLTALAGDAGLPTLRSPVATGLGLGLLAAGGLAACAVAWRRQRAAAATQADQGGRPWP